MFSLQMKIFLVAALPASWLVGYEAGTIAGRSHLMRETIVRVESPAYLNHVFFGTCAIFNIKGDRYEACATDLSDDDEAAK